MYLFNIHKSKFGWLALILSILLASCVQSDPSTVDNPQELFDFAAYLQDYKKEFQSQKGWKKSITKYKVSEIKEINSEQFIEDLDILNLFHINPIVSHHYRIDSLIELNVVKEISAESQNQKDKIKLFKVEFENQLVKRIISEYRVKSLIGRREVKLIWEGEKGYNLVITEGKGPEAENTEIKYFQ